MAKRQPYFPKAIKLAIIGSVGVLLGRHWLRLQRHLELTNRIVLITGGSRGLGLALAREFSRRNAKVAICARDGAELELVKAELPLVETFICDLTDASQVKALITQVESKVGPIDVLVNNAATIIVGPAENMNAADFQLAMDTNFWPAVHSTLELAPKMKSRGGGRIVNIASVGGKMPVPHLAPYCASKFALVGFSGTMRAELLSSGIYVTTINPGMINSGSPRHALFKGKHKDEFGWFSIADSVPGLSQNLETAARTIIEACINGTADVTLGLPAKLGSIAYGIAPSLHLELSTLANRLLPGIAQDSSTTKAGAESQSWITRSFLRYFGKLAEKQYNQLRS